MLSLETGLQSVDRDFDVENTILNLPKSPFKSVVIVGTDERIISDCSIEVSAIEKVTKRVKVNSQDDLC